MPELPEVETIRRSLLSIIGRRIEAVEVVEPRLRRRVAENFTSQLVGRLIEGIERRGKYLLFHLSGVLPEEERANRRPFAGGESLLVHLGMSGALLLQPAGTSRQLHDHVRIRLSGDVQLMYNDPRRFGLLRAGHTAEFVELGNVGPDPLAETFSAADLAALVRGRKKPVKNLLMDQRALGGIGNIYANEILFRAGIRPGRQARRLTWCDIIRLLDATRAVLRSAVRHGGSSISDYRDGSGRRGYFQLRLRVYGRAGEPCLRCRTAIRRTVHAGRSSFYCPKCQR